ncbi:MAG: MarR family transcriptional regulator [Gelidibacter sp.]|nr:MarR family transcriptional regulator [Gelidibacter sp.]
MKAKIQALLKQIHSGKRQSDKARVLDFVMKHPYCTTVDVEVKLNMLHQTASARISDLLDLGVIEERGTKETATSNFTYLKYQPDYLQQVINSRNRKKDKYDNWVKKGLTQFNDLINPELKFQLQCKK